MLGNQDNNSLIQSNGLSSDESGDGGDAPLIKKKENSNSSGCCASFFKCKLGPCSDNKGLRVFGLIVEVLVICGILGGIIAGIVIGVEVSSVPLGVCDLDAGTVSFPDSVTSIKASTVPYCNTADTVFISKNVTKISNKAFDELINLKRFTVEQGSTTFRDDNGVLYRINKEGFYELIRVPRNFFKEIIMTPGTKKILKHSFYGCPGQTIVINDELETIEGGAFAGSAQGNIIADEDNEFMLSLNNNSIEGDTAYLYENDFQSNKATVTIKGIPHTKQLDKKTKSRLVLAVNGITANGLEKKMDFAPSDEEIEYDVKVTYKDGDAEMTFHNTDRFYVTIHCKYYIPEVVSVGEPIEFVRNISGLESFTLTDDDGVTVNVMLENSIATIHNNTITFSKLNHYIAEGVKGGETSTQNVNVALKECKDNPQMVTVPNGIAYLPVSSFYGCYDTTIIVIPASVEDIHKSTLSHVEHKEVVIVDSRSPAKVENCDLGSDYNGYYLSYETIPVIRYDFINPPVVGVPSNYIRDNYSLGFVFNAENEGDKLILHGENTVGEGVVVYEKEYVAGHKGINFIKTDPLSKGKYELMSNSKGVAPIEVVNWFVDQYNMGVPDDLEEGTFDLVIPYGVDKIDFYQYEYTLSIRSVVITPTVLTIGHMAFNGCTNLVDVTIQGGVRVIESYAFGYTGIETITVPGSIDMIDNCAFVGNYELESIVLEEGIMTLGAEVFSYSTSLTQIVIPRSIIEIGDNPFVQCTSLEVIQSNNPKYPTSVGLEFGTSSAKLITFMCWKAEATANSEISNAYNTILPYAFSQCQNIKTVKLDLNITHVDSYAFSYCPLLETVVVSERLKFVGNGLFENSLTIPQFSFPYSLWKEGTVEYSCLQFSNVEEVCFVGVDGDCPSTLGESVSLYGKSGIHAVCSDTCPNVI